MPDPCSFDYVIVRVVPHVEREEFINAGVIVFCDGHDFLAARVELDEARLAALAPDADVELVRRHLDAIPRICEGGPAAGSIGRLTARERWHWLTGPRSTVVQTSAPHAGLAENLEDVLACIMDRVVRLPTRA